MNIRVPHGEYPPRVLLQRAGYHEFQDPRTGETSYVRRLGAYFYPRFHVYFTIEQNQLVISLHLDQKQASYTGQRKHSGEYSGPLVEEEADRIYQIITQV